MPSGYAHYRFGSEMLPLLPGEGSRLAQRFRQLYDVGLQGPDPLFYYNPVFRSNMGALASRLHRQSGREFFGNALKKLKVSPSEGARAYLFGLLGHYCLDSVCHPYVRGVAAVGRIGHTEMETEFDRFLMEKDGIAKPHRFSMGDHYRLTRGECVTAALFLEPATPAAINRCVRSMIRVDRLATMKNRKLAKNLMGFGGNTGLQMLMGETPNEKCVGTNAALLSLYEQAAEQYPNLARQLSDAMETGDTLGDDFAPCFG